MPFEFGNASSKPSVASAGSTGDIDASTPWVAAADGNLDLLKASLERLCVPPSAADENGYTLLQAAASYGQLHVLSWLLNLPQPINVNAADNEGDTALHYAASTDTAKLLVESGVSPTIQNHDGKTALDSKRDELQEAMEDDDYDDEDEDNVSLRLLVSYLSSLQSRSQ
jgi:ankyrin repeat protein